MKILTIIVSYNFERWIDRCLGSLRASLHPTDVLVIDNCSKDQTVERIRRDWPKVRLIANDANLGFGKANNLGMTIALEEGYDAVFLLNQDAWIDEHTLGTLAAHAVQTAGTTGENTGEAFGENTGETSSGTRWGILSPVHCDGSGEHLDFGFAHYTQLQSKEELQQKNVAGQKAPIAGISPVASLIEAPFVNAAFWFIPRTVLNQVGGFSPLFYHYGEDKDYVNRLTYYGYKIGYDPTIFGCHDRAFRKTTEFDFFRAEKVYLLSEYANPNYSFLKGFAYGVLAGIKKALQALLKGNLHYASQFTGIVWWLLRQTFTIRKRRKQYQSGKPVFLT